MSHGISHLPIVSLTKAIFDLISSNTRPGLEIFAATLSMLREAVFGDEASIQNIARNLPDDLATRQYSRASCVFPRPPMPSSTTILGPDASPVVYAKFFLISSSSSTRSTYRDTCNDGIS